MRRGESGVWSCLVQVHLRGGATHALHPDVLDAGDIRSNVVLRDDHMAVKDAVGPSPARKFGAWKSKVVPAGAARATDDPSRTATVATATAETACHAFCEWTGLSGLD